MYFKSHSGNAMATYRGGGGYNTETRPRSPGVAITPRPGVAITPSTRHWSGNDFYNTKYRKSTWCYNHPLLYIIYLV